MNLKSKNKPVSGPLGLSSPAQSPRGGSVGPCKGYARASRWLAHLLFGDKALSLANVSEEVEVLGLTNAFTVDADGWATIPYGDHRHSGADGRKTEAEARIARLANGEAAPKAVIQRFTREDAEQMVAHYKSTWGRIKRAVVGLPIFKGHPDAPRFANLFPDKTPRGAIADMEVGELGLRIRPVLTEQGANDVKAGWNEFSPYWDCIKVGEAEPGVPIASPFKLHSIGLVPRGNLAGVSLVNSAVDSTMKNQLLSLLAAMGIKIAADADDTALNAAVTQATGVFSAANAAVTELVVVKADKTKADEKIVSLEAEKLSLANAKTALEGEKEALTTAKATLEANFLKERKAHATSLANGAFTAGKLTAPERDAAITALCNAGDAFEVEAAKLTAKKAGYKVSSSVSALANGKAPGLERGEQILALVNARIAETGEDYTTAYTTVQGDSKHAALFPQPAAKK